MQDITPPNNRRSIRSIVSSKKQRSNEANEGTYQIPITVQRTDSFFSEKSKKRMGLWKWGSIAIAVLIIVLFVINIFSSTEIIITPEKTTVEVDSSYQSLPTGGDISFETVTLESQIDRVVPATGEELVEERATGFLTVYNEYSDESQRLIPNTRFETPEGLIFRTPEVIIVPGRSGNNPGSITVQVTADQPGSEYNIPSSEFKLPGLSGTDFFEDIYARSTESFTGGIADVIPVVSDADKATAESELQNDLKENLQKDVVVNIPDELILFSDGTYLEFQTRVLSGDDNSTGIIRVVGKLHGVLFDKNSLSSLIAGNYLEDYDGRDVLIENFQELNVLFESDENNVPVYQKDSITLQVSGNANIVWVIDKDGVKNSLERQPRRDISIILAKYPEISEAEVRIFPPWKRSFPVAQDIKVTVN